MPLACSEGRLAFKETSLCGWWCWRRWGQRLLGRGRCLQLRGRAGARALLLAEGRRHAGEAEYGVHLRMHRYGLAVPARAYLGAVVVRPVVVVAARDDLAAFDEDRAKREAHRALRCRIGALREIELRLVHENRSRSFFSAGCR